MSLPKLCLYILAVALGILFAFKTEEARAAAASHVVISEVQLGTIASSTDEFIELYNPTALDINLTNWQLTKRTSTGIPTILISTMSGTIKSHGYFLITPQTGYTGSASADATYPSDTISANNSLTLYSDAGSTIVNKVGFGTSTASETATTTNPAAGDSRERKALATSTKAKMAIGGADEFAGNGEDMDNNSNDFVGRDVPQPQNTVSSLEPVATATVTPTLEPTSTLTPTVSPTLTLTPTPSLTLTPTLEPTVTLTPTTEPSPTSTVTPAPFPNFHVVCTTKNLVIRVLNFTINVPLVSCSLVRG